MAKIKFPKADKQALKALRSAVKKALIERKRLGVLMSIWKDDKVVTIPAHKINLKQFGL
jgi:hypothetical protein